MKKSYEWNWNKSNAIAHGKSEQIMPTNVSTDSRPVIIVAMNQELTTDASLRRKFKTAEDRARRQRGRYESLDLLETEEAVAENLLATQLRMDGEYLGLLDLINRARNGRHSVPVTPDNVKSHLSLANTVTLNGIFLYNYLSERGFNPVVVQNWAAERAFFEELLTLHPLAVIISSTYLSMEAVKQIGARAKAKAPGVPVIAGGPLVNKIMRDGEEIAETTSRWLSGFRDAVDIFVIESQGEKTLVKTLSKLSQGESVEGVENLALSTDAGWKFTERLEEPVNMDEGAIAWDRIPPEYLRSTAPVNTSRGCVFRCRFCTYRKLVKGIHYKSLECLRKELESLARVSSIKHVRFTDDNFTANRKRLISVCEMLIDMGTPFTWTSFARSDSITPETARIMKEAGCVFLEMGLESGSQQILDNMDKQQSVDDIKRAIETLNKVGIAASGAFIVGYPGETEQSIRETVQLINNTGLPFYRLNFFAFSKGMLLFEEKEKYGLSGLGFAWRHNTMDAVQASHHFRQMLQDITQGVTDGLSSTWETFKLLSGEGLSGKAIFELFRLSNKLNRLRMSEGDQSLDWRRRHDEWWTEFEALLRRSGAL